MTKPNIHQHTAAICKKLGLEPGLVRSMTLTSTEVVAEVFLTNENGSKYVDLARGVPATEERKFAVVA